MSTPTNAATLSTTVAASTPFATVASTKKKGGRAKPPENETPEAAFIRVMKARLSKTLAAIDLIGNLVGSSYKSNETQIANIEKRLNERVAKAILTLRAGKKTVEPEAVDF